MLLRWAALITSLLALIGGFLMSLTFLQWFAVPHLLYRIASMPRLTQCYIFEPYGDKQVPEDRLGQRSPSGKCIYIPLKYKDTEKGPSKQGYLMQNPVKKIEVARKQEKRCFCEDCSIRITRETNTSTINVLSYNIPTRQWVTCYRQSNDQGNLKPNSTLYMFNAMLWPSLLFVLGFVGIFFSCLDIQKEQWSASNTCDCIIN